MQWVIMMVLLLRIEDGVGVKWGERVKEEEVYLYLRKTAFTFFEMLYGIFEYTSFRLPICIPSNQMINSGCIHAIKGK